MYDKRIMTIPRHIVRERYCEESHLVFCPTNLYDINDLFKYSKVEYVYDPCQMYTSVPVEIGMLITNSQRSAIVLKKNRANKLCVMNCPIYEDTINLLKDSSMNIASDTTKLWPEETTSTNSYELISLSLLNMFVTDPSNEFTVSVGSPSMMNILRTLLEDGFYLMCPNSEELVSIHIDEDELKYVLSYDEQNVMSPLRIYIPFITSTTTVGFEPNPNKYQFLSKSNIMHQRVRLHHNTGYSSITEISKNAELIQELTRCLKYVKTM